MSEEKPAKKEEKPVEKEETPAESKVESKAVPAVEAEKLLKQNPIQ